MRVPGSNKMSLLKLRAEGYKILQEAKSMNP